MARAPAVAVPRASRAAVGSGLGYRLGAVAARGTPVGGAARRPALCVNHLQLRQNLNSAATLRFHRQPNEKYRARALRASGCRGRSYTRAAARNAARRASHTAAVSVVQCAAHGDSPC
jgi:hypothetical protein